ncbi:MAG TPA: hypothetical protein VGS28_02560 [Candidatus Saccharimonadales bacterium]|nr:hypothetical protein [Candidatus Saccharimonadales bacterium]
MHEKLRDSSSSSLLMFGMIALIVIASVFALVGWYFYQRSSNASIPPSVVQQILFGIYYLPHELPTGYRIDRSSYTVREATLLFGATDNQGDNIAFSEQSAPANFNFQNFYSQAMLRPVRLLGTPFNSVAGRARSNQPRNLLSIEANGTWLLITAPLSLTNAQLTSIAQHIEPGH